MQQVKNDGTLDKQVTTIDAVAAAIVLQAMLDDIETASVVVTRAAKSETGAELVRGASGERDGSSSRN